MTNNIEDVYVFPTTYPQRQIWFLYQLNPENPAYNIPFAYDVEGELNVFAIDKAINEIVSRHETFRTTFMDTDNGLVQVIKPELEIKLPVYGDLKTEDEIKKHIETESIRAFDLTKGPLIRASIIKHSESSFILFINIHHIILDHISVVQFAEELTLLYKTFSNDQASPLVKPELQYADYAVWQSENQTGEQLSSKLKFWTEKLTGKTDYLDIPLNNKRPVIQQMVGNEYHLSMPLSLLNNLKALSRKESVSMYITLMAAYSILLSIYSKQTEVSVGTPFANRSHQPELEKIMGCFINTIPIYTDLSGNPSFNEVLKRVRKMVFAANANQELPFEMIVEALKPKRDTSYNPLFQVGFTFQEPPMEIELEGCSVKSQCLHNKS
ncbi:Polyketide synthase modules and related proteins, partial [hydrothermal vent metagenome]